MPRNADARPLLTLGVVAHSRKENERRLPIHPMHFQRIDADLREHIYLENGYGESFGVTDEQLAPYVGGLLPRDGLLGDCDVIVLPKLQPSDLAEMREGQIVWGWPHCVQDAEVTQLAIDRRLTLIAFEAMNHWARDGGFLLHVFHKNSELAGYCSVLHALELIGTTGIYGRLAIVRNRRMSVIGDTDNPAPAPPPPVTERRTARQHRRLPTASRPAPYVVRACASTPAMWSRPETASLRHSNTPSDQGVF